MSGENEYMIEGKNILAIIPARGGSKGLPEKNLKVLAGKPLISWTIEQALASRYLDKVIVSTDDEKIADVSKKCGAEVPFKRPVKYATDTASSADVIIHALDFFRDRGETYDYIALLEPTSPLRKKNDIDNGIKKLVGNPEKDTLVSVGVIHLEHPMIAKKVRDDIVVPYADYPKIFQRQQADKAFFPYGVIYLSKTKTFYETKTFYGERTLPLFIERWQNYEVDDIIDFIVIERIFQEYKERF